MRWPHWLSRTLSVARWSLLVVAFPACNHVPDRGAEPPRPAPSASKPKVRVVGVAPEGCAVLEGGDWLCPTGSATPENGCSLERRPPPSVPRGKEAEGCTIDAEEWVNCPKAAKLLPRAVALGAGSGFWCALQQSGSVVCWGDNGEGGLGDGRSYRATRPVRVRLGQPARQLAVGSGHGCALVTDGSVWCWGDNARGTLGLGVLPPCCSLEPDPRRPYAYLTPQRVPGLGPVASIHARDIGSCAVTVEGAVLCWGENEGGELGSPQSAEPLAAPTRVPGLPPVVELEMGYPICALTRKHEVYCWGDMCPVVSTVDGPHKIDWASLPGGS